MRIAPHTWVCVAPLTRLALLLEKLMSTVASKTVGTGGGGAAPTGPPPAPMLALIFAAMAAAAWMAARLGLIAMSPREGRFPEKEVMPLHGHTYNQVWEEIR